MNKNRNDADRIQGLASILTSANKSKPATPSPAPPLEAPASAVEPPRRQKTGKSSDPNFHHYGFYLRKDTHKRAKRKLEDLDNGQDLSDLLQELLQKWLTAD